MEALGWIGSGLFAICSLPQAVQCAKDGHARGLNWFFLLAWLGGTVCTGIYLIPKMDYALLVNYGMNLIFVSLIIRYKLFERK